MQEQIIYGESPSFFNEMLEEIKEFTQKLNQIDWKFECEF